MISREKSFFEKHGEISNDFISLKITEDFISKDLCCAGVGVKHFDASYTMENNIADFDTAVLKEYYLLFYVVSGCCRIFLDNTFYVLESDTIMIASPGSQIHFESQELESQSCYILLGGELSKKYLSRIIDNLGIVFPMDKNFSVANTINQIINSFYLGISIDDSGAAMFAFQILSELYRFLKDENRHKYPLIISSALNIIRKDYAYIYGVDELAEELNVSKSHLIRIFTKYIGISPGKYLTNIRLENAKLFLASGDYSVEAVANMSGYSDSNYFCKAFKKNTGVTPKQYADNKSTSKKHLTKRSDKSEGYLY